MPPPSPTDNLNTAPYVDLISLLLRQFQNLLAQHGMELNRDDIGQIAITISEESDFRLQNDSLHSAMQAIVNESLSLLQDKFGFTFSESLNRAMTDIDGWETTEEFLDIANEKNNAELRISAGATLLVAMNDRTYAPFLVDTIVFDAGANDADAILARRVLSHVSTIPLGAPDWMNRIEDWLQT